MIGFEQPAALWALLLAIPVVAAAVFSRRRLPWPRRALGVGVRLLLLTLLVAALAKVSWRTTSEDLAVVFVLDRSASVGDAGRATAEQFVRDALTAADDGDVAGVVTFGGQAMVEASPRRALRLPVVETAPSPHASDLAAGVRLAAGLLPADRVGRIVVLSDGEETRGDVVDQGLATAASDVEIAVVPLRADRGPDVLLEDLLVPPRVDEGAPYEVRVVARADGPVSGKLRLYRNETFLGELPVQLEGGRAEVIPIRQTAASPGLYRYRAVLDVGGQQDALPQNDEAVGTTQVSGRPRVLYAEGVPGQARHLQAALEGEGLVVDVVGPADLPANLSALRPYAAVILSDVPSYALTNRQQAAMQSFVRDLGRGLAMVGGDQSFGLGGYIATPIEEALPVRMDIEDKSRFPKLAMVHAIDKSCSMDDGGAGSKLEMARSASRLTIQLLSPRDELGIIGFDEAASWVMPLQPLSDKKAATDLVSSLRTGGGTDIYPAIERGNAALRQSDAATKHIIVISDGITATGAFEPLIRGGARDKITLSAVAIGGDADRATMDSFAKWGGGQAYIVKDPTVIPQIFTREALLASGSFLIEEDFRPRPREPSEVLRGFAAGDLPTLHGFVGTTAKPLATVALDSGGDHPLPVLAHGRYGLGRSLAFTSDCKARWSRDWIGTESYTRFWGQIARWLVGDPNGGTAQVEAEIQDGQLVVTVDAFDADGGFRNFLDGEARIVAPDLTVHPVPLQQIAPGRYRASMPADQDGSWLAGVALQSGEQVVAQGVAEAVQPYSPEYRRGGVGGAVLAELGRIGHGGALTTPADAFRPPVAPRAIPWPLWPWALGAAAFLLVLDVAIRRLGVGGRGEITSFLAAAAAPSRALPGKPTARHAPTAAEVTEPVVDAAPTRPAAPPPEPGSYAGRLLEARKRAGKRTGKEDP